MSFHSSALIVSWVAILLLALVVSGLVRQVHALSAGGVRRDRPLGLPPGTPAPGLHDLPGAGPGPRVVLFLDRECRTCDQLLADLAAHPRDSEVTLHVLYRAAAPADPPVAVSDHQAELFDRYDAIATPFAVVVDPAGRVVRSELLGSRVALRSLLAQLSGVSAPAAPPVIRSKGAS